MLKINIESCPDDDLIGEHTFFYQDLRFGRHKKNEFIIKSEGIPDKAISINCQPQGIFVKSEQIDHFLSNGKKVKGEKIHKPGDKIEFMGTVIEFKEYDIKTINESTKQTEMINDLETLEGQAAQVAQDIKELLEKKD